jgi:hypothetical protein
VFHTYVTVCYVVLLRGSEGLLLDLSGLKQKWGVGGDEYVTIALLGKINGENDNCAHLLPSVPVTLSGVDVAGSLKRLISLKEHSGLVSGPAISNLSGGIYEPSDMNNALLEVLEDLFDNHEELFPALVKDKELLQSIYQAFRTSRRTSDTRAIKMNVAQPDIDLVNRWKTVKKADGKRPSCPMRQCYAKFGLLLASFLCYTWMM